MQTAANCARNPACSGYPAAATHSRRPTPMTRLRRTFARPVPSLAKVRGAGSALRRTGSTADVKAGTRLTAAGAAVPPPCSDCPIISSNNLGSQNEKNFIHHCDHHRRDRGRHACLFPFAQRGRIVNWQASRRANMGRASARLQSRWRHTFHASAKAITDTRNVRQRLSGHERRTGSVGFVENKAAVILLLPRIGNVPGHRLRLVFPENLGFLRYVDNLRSFERAADWKAPRICRK